MLKFLLTGTKRGLKPRDGQTAALSYCSSHKQMERESLAEHVGQITKLPKWSYRIDLPPASFVSDIHEGERDQQRGGLSSNVLGWQMGVHSEFNSR